jgi:hypothetical protein
MAQWGVMLIEIWERLRGYDKWIQTEAKIKSSELAEVEIGRIRPNRFSDSEPIDEWHSTCGLAWTDTVGGQHTDQFEVAENSPLFQLYDGQTVTIRYNPTNSNQYYLRGLLMAKAGIGFRRGFYFLARVFGRG